MKRFLALLLTILSVIAACRGAPRGEAVVPEAGGVVALVGGIVHPGPDAAPISDGVVVIDGERIAAVGPRADIRIPEDALVMDVRGRTILPGFWNSHVHFIQPEWSTIESMAAERANELLRDRFMRFGFVHLFDVGSFSDVAPDLRGRIRRGEAIGPDILTTLLPFVPPNGTPRYVAPMKLPELYGAAEARDSVRARVARGADAIKLFTMPITDAEPFPVMEPAVVKAVTEEAHRAGRLVFAHPTDLPGVQVAVEGGVDILAHTAPSAGTLPGSLLGSMLRRDVALIPTLTLWEVDVGPDTAGIALFVRAAQDQVRAYAERGGRILFGTDAGYIAHYDPTREYELMAGAGLDFRAILATLTTAPATEFGWGDRTGRLAPGFDADVVVVDGDPTLDIRVLGRVTLTVKQGRILFDADNHQLY